MTKGTKGGKKEVAKKTIIEISDQEAALLSENRKKRELIEKCAVEIAAVLKKYNMHLETTKPEVVVVPNANA